jgi:hypothetical protein
MRVASLIMLILAVSYSQQAQGVCVFDLDGTLILNKDKSLSKAAVKACEDAGYKLAINTAEPNGFCLAWSKFQNAPRSGVSYGKNVPKEMWMCRGLHFHQTKSKIANMVKAMAYYKTTKECMVLYDDNAGNVEAVIGAGFQGMHINHDGQGISAADGAAGLAKLKGCDGFAKTH